MGGEGPGTGGDKDKMKKARPLGRKIARTMIAIVTGMIVAVSAVFLLTTSQVSETVDASGRELHDSLRDHSSAYLAEQTRTRLMEFVSEEANIADVVFADIESGVNTVAAVAQQIYNHPEQYSPRPAALPDPENDGKLAVQVLYSASTDPDAPAIVEELGLIGNVQDALLAVNASHKEIASIYVATESGFMVQADYISGKKFDRDGQLMPLEARQRPWYVAAKLNKKPSFTRVYRDAHTPRLTIGYSVPIYRQNRLVAVAAAGMYLDDTDRVVQSIDLGRSGDACIINENGQVLFSTYSEGTLAAAVNAADLRYASEAGLGDIVKQATKGKSGFEQMTVDGIPTYVAFAPMKTVGWSMMFFLSKEAVDAPSREMLDKVDMTTGQAYQKISRQTKQALYMLLGLLAAALVIALIVSVVLSRQIVKPIHLLTEKVSAMKGDSLDFDWTLDTGDETQTLARSFQSLTQRMKDYIRDIAAITAKNERISTELTLAASIQTNMLPNVFPPYPDRQDMDIYAYMGAAREVGGDFYDFFLIDENHLCAVIADVSGKGIPAALFMMATKTILSNYAMLGQHPSQVLENANASICATNKDDMFVTVWLGILDLRTGLLTAANAGHEYPIIVKNGGATLYTDTHGFVLGGLEGMRYQEYEIQLDPGDKLFVYTDGVPEAMDCNKHLFGLDRMLQAIGRCPEKSPKHILTAVKKAVDDYVGDAEQFDDLTMLCLEYRGPKNAAIRNG